MSIPISDLTKDDLFLMKEELTNKFYRESIFHWAGTTEIQSQKPQLGSTFTSAVKLDIGNYIDTDELFNDAYEYYVVLERQFCGGSVKKVDVSKIDDEFYKSLCGPPVVMIGGDVWPSMLKDPDLGTRVDPSHTHAQLMRGRLGIISKTLLITDACRHPQHRLLGSNERVNFNKFYYELEQTVPVITGTAISWELKIRVS